MTLAQIRAARAAKVAAARALVTTAQTENRSLTTEQQATFATLQSEITALEADEARQQFLDDAERRSTGVTISGGGGDTVAALEGNVSLLRVLQAGVEGRALTGAEAEYQQETERRTGRKAQGVFVPMRLLEQRAPVTTTSAGELVGTDHRGDLYIQPLRNKLLARRLGVRVLSGLHGNVSVPKHGTGVSVGWVAENGAVPETDVDPSNVTLSPKHAGGYLELTRQLIMQSSPDVEALVRDDFAAVLAQAIDSALIIGGANKPTGIMSTVGVQTANLATLNWAAVLAMKAKAELANADATSWLFNPAVAAKLAGTEKSTGTGIYLLNDEGRMAGIQGYSTNPVPNVTGTPDKGVAILGDWSQVLLGIWSEIDILVNPYAQPAYGRGGVLIRAMSTVDVAVRHPQAFVVASDITL